MKRPAQLQELLDVAREMLKELLLQQTRNTARRSGAQEADRAAAAAESAGSRLGDSPSADSGAGSARREHEEQEQELQDDLEDDVEKLRQVVAVLEEGGHFSGINRKAQLKPLAWRVSRLFRHLHKLGPARLGSNLSVCHCVVPCALLVLSSHIAALFG
jgi:hypothetical protein